MLRLAGPPHLGGHVRDYFGAQRIMQGAKPRTAPQWVFLIIKLIAALASVALLCVSLVMWSWGVSDKSCKTGSAWCPGSAHMVNTYLTTSKTDLPLSWPVRMQDNFAANLLPDALKGTANLVQCIWKSNWGPDKCQGVATLDNYSYCLQVNYTSTYNGLTSCGSTGYTFPDAYKYQSCAKILFPAYPPSSLNRFQACLVTEPWAQYQVLQGVDSQKLFGAFNWYQLLLTGLWAFTSFAVYTSWPFDFEFADFELKDGAPKYALSRLGFLFAIVACAWNAWLLVFEILVGFRTGTVTGQDDWQYPTSLTTSVITILFAVAAFFYMLLQSWQVYYSGPNAYRTRYDLPPGSTPAPSFAPTVVRPGSDEVTPFSPASSTSTQWRRVAVSRLAQKPVGYSALSVGFNHNLPDSSPDETEFGFMSVGEYFYDVLSQLWSEAYLFDPLILVGFLGCTVQLRLEDAWTVFFSALLFRVLGIVIVRVNCQALAGKAYESDKYETTILMCLVAQLYPLVQIFLVATDSDRVWNATLFTVFFGLSYAGGYIGYVFFQSFFLGRFKLTSARDDGKMPHKITSGPHGTFSTHNSYFQGYFLLFSQLLWAWDVLLRLVFVLLLLTGSGDGTLGAVKGALSDMSPYVTSAMYTEIIWSASGGAFA